MVVSVAGLDVFQPITLAFNQRRHNLLHYLSLLVHQEYSVTGNRLVKQAGGYFALTYQ